MLLGIRDIDDGCAAGWEILHGKRLRCWVGRGRTAGLLGGRKYDCWVDDRWTTRRERALLLGKREVDDGCAAG